MESFVLYPRYLGSYFLSCMESFVLYPGYFRKLFLYLWKFFVLYPRNILWKVLFYNQVI